MTLSATQQTIRPTPPRFANVRGVANGCAAVSGPAVTRAVARLTRKKVVSLMVSAKTGSTALALHYLGDERGDGDDATTRLDILPARNLRYVGNGDKYMAAGRLEETCDWCRQEHRSNRSSYI
jgi:hypothetical protein